MKDVRPEEQSKPAHKNTKAGRFKDHDFAVFRNKDTEEEIYADSTAFDHSGAGRSINIKSDRKT
ncbi:MAG: hypothetical protein LBR26_01170 [Prevotella sp.]|jgi:hypothetical protein|nr:hypothetical protein [Prevotella sp.]